MIGTRDQIKDSKLERTRIFDVYEPLSCKKCNKSFKKKAWLKAHVKEHEFDDHTYECKKPDLAKYRPYECEICENRFTAKRNLLKHLRVIHKNFTEAEKLKIRKTRCPESNCMFTCNRMKDLRIHIEKCHNIVMIKDILHFTNEKGFLKWKKEEEENSTSSFVSFRRGVKLKNGLTKRILQCHRTGQYNPKGTGKHRLKSHGSCKIGGTCPAAMEVTLSPDNGQVTVIYYKIHIGHSQDVAHLPLSREDKEKILERIKQGFTFDAILEDIQESINPQVGKTKRIHFLSKKDLYNIVQSFNDKKEKANQGENQERKRNLNIYEKILEPSDPQMSEELPEKEEVRDNNFMNNDNKTSMIELSNIQNESLTMNCKDVSQQILVSPNVSYVSLPKVILLQQTQAVTPVITKPYNKTLVFVSEDENKRERENELRSESSKNVLFKSSLGQKLKEKIEKLLEFLPKSEFLTIKQYETVDAKLDSIINVFDSVRVKTKSKNLSPKRKGSEKGKDEMPHKNLKAGETAASAPQNMEQHVFQAPVYAYVWNCN